MNAQLLLIFAVLDSVLGMLIIALTPNSDGGIAMFLFLVRLVSWSGVGLTCYVISRLLPLRYRHWPMWSLFCVGYLAIALVASLFGEGKRVWEVLAAIHSDIHLYAVFYVPYLIASLIALSVPGLRTMRYVQDALARTE